ncbi:hypothetical protein [Streptomyces sp. YIM S03343]
MSFHKIVPVKKHREPIAPAPKPVAKKVAKKPTPAPKRRPIDHQG